MNTETTSGDDHGLPSIPEQREALRHSVINAPNRYRLIFVGNFFQGPTGIVASMHRALENLGHTVFKLDTARHREVLDRSSGAKGGYGPIWFRPREMSRILDVFEPDAVILCAGGMVLTPDDSNYLRDRGVVSIGLTLSDPDVQDSVIEHVGNFDLHTTNAQLAYERYLREGHSNTLLFPFGIDRSFVLREVADDPALHADAIAIGHAQGRPDRHEIMVPLAEKVKVRTYGSGWPIPGSEPVSGDRLLQAAKAGTVHVNFPATRAGFTNVKCGVFETIGAGAVLATTEFDEMARLFEYGTEILAYSDATDLGNAIAELVGNPQELERMRRRSFRRLIADHLYERRWNTFFDEAQQLLWEGGGPWTDSERSRIGRTLDQNHDRPRNILISGYYGARNRGDDILLDALRTRITAQIPDANIIAASVNPKVVEQTQGIQSFRRTDPFESDNYASAATSMILGPGGLWHDYTIQKAFGVAGIVTGATLSPSHLAQLPLMVRAYGGSFHVHGMGVGPLTDVAAKASVHLTGLLAESITVRDAASSALLADCSDGWTAEAEVSPDVAYTLPLADLDSAPVDWRPPTKYIAVNVRPFREQADSLATIRDVVFEFARNNDLAVLGVPMQPVDSEALQSWASRAEGIDFSVLPQDAPYEAFLRSLADAAVIVSMRLHTNLFAHRLGKAPVGIAYDPKLVGHFTQLGRAEYAVSMPVGASELRDRLAAVYTEGDLDENVRGRISQLENAADESLIQLCHHIADAPKKLPSSASMVQAPPKSESKKVVASRWPEEQNVSLKNAVVVGGNEEDPDREVDVVRRSTSRGDQFAIEARAPKRGDFASWSIDVPVPSGEDGVRIELLVYQKYQEKKRFTGRLAYSVSVDDTMLFHEDVTGWSERSAIWIGKRTSSPSVHIEVRLYALRDTENWGWGKATATTVEGLRAMPWKASADLVWGSSSPSAMADAPRGPESEPTAAAVAGSAGATVALDPRDQVESAEPGSKAPSHTTSEGIAGQTKAPELEATTAQSKDDVARPTGVGSATATGARLPDESHAKPQISADQPGSTPGKPAERPWWKVW